MLTSFLHEQQQIGLGFREQTKSTILFIVTTDSIMSYNTTANKPTVVKYILQYLKILVNTHTVSGAHKKNRPRWMNKVVI